MGTDAYFVKCHSVLDQQGNTRVEITDVSFQNKILFRLSRNLSLEVAKTLLRYKNAFQSEPTTHKNGDRNEPLAKSSSTSTSCSAAMLKRAVTL